MCLRRWSKRWMGDRIMTERKPDYMIFVLVMILSLFGLIMVFSASYYTLF